LPRKKNCCFCRLPLSGSVFSAGCSFWSEAADSELWRCDRNNHKNVNIWLWWRGQCRWRRRLCSGHSPCCCYTWSSRVRRWPRQTA
jgi:hypothetical protein